MAVNRPKEICRLRSKRWRLNEKYCQLVNDDIAYNSYEIQRLLDTILKLDNKISNLKIGLDE